MGDPSYGVDESDRLVIVFELEGSVDLATAVIQ